MKKRGSGGGSSGSVKMKKPPIAINPEADVSTDSLEADWQFITPSPTELSYLAEQTFRKHRGSGNLTLRWLLEERMGEDFCE